MSRRWVILCAVLLAGCSESPPAEETEETDFGEFELEETAAGLGVIRGVVVDPSIQPLAGAVVSISGTGFNVTTGESGAFAFKDLAPGAYFVVVQKVGYRDTQTSTEVVAGEHNPRVVRVMLERMPGTEPNLVPDLFKGHITCSIRVPAAGFNDGCLLFGNLGLGSTQRKDIGFPGGNILWIQTEMIWDQAFQTSERLCMDQGAVLHAEVICGPTPILGEMDRNEIEGRGLDKNNTFPYIVYPDHLLMGASGNVVLEQPFEVYSHAFYNFLPPEGWQFGRDGEPPVPA